MRRSSHYILSILISLIGITTYANDTLPCSTNTILSERDLLRINHDSEVDHAAVSCFIKSLKSNPISKNNELKVIHKIDSLYWYCYDNSELGLAIELMETQALLWKEIDSIRQYNMSIYELANCHFYLGNYVQSFELIQESIELANSNTDEHRLMLSYGKLSWLLLRINRYDEAIKANNLFYQYLKKLNSEDKYLNAYYNFLANLYADQDDIPNAKYYNDSAMYYANQTGNEALIAIAKSNKSMFYEGVENIIPRINLAKEALVRNGNIREIGISYKHLGKLYQLVPENDSTYKYYNLALQVLKSTGDQYHEYLTHHQFVTYYENKRDYDKAYFHQNNATLIYYDLFGARETAKIYEIEKQISERKNQATKLSLEKQNAQIELDLLKNNQKKLYLLLSSLLVIGLLFLYYYRHKNLQRLKKLKLKKEAEKEIINLRKQAIRSQLNPHFLFNNLNSIKSYIATNEPRKATRYLNKFALLMRSILNNSIRDKVQLNEEIEALKLFIEIEKYRLKCDIKFKEELDENIDYNSILVSPSILQPFVENGIFQFHKDHSPFYIHLSIEDSNIEEIVVTIKMHRDEDFQTSPTLHFTKVNDQTSSQIIYDIKDRNGNIVGSSVRFTISKKN